MRPSHFDEPMDEKGRLDKTRRKNKALTLVPVGEVKPHAAMTAKHSLRKINARLTRSRQFE
jgi:hypothetical protein